jgi:tight adherence protein C
MELLFDSFGENWPLIGGGLMLFFAIFSISFLLMQRAQASQELRRRAQGIKLEAADSRALAGKGRMSMDKLIAGISKHFDSIDPVRAKVLRNQLIQAGIYDPRWVPGFFALRAISAVGCGVLGYLGLPYVLSLASANMHIVITSGCALIGYMAPVFWLSKRIEKKAREHRAGFPDFMDLLVVCADAGVSMEAALNRVGGELAESYPSLSANLHLATLEIRAGKTISDALEHLGDRLSIEEAKTFATLLQQSEELGSSLTDALRIYSDEMRHKRLSRAEEKAHALPAKMSVPVTVCILPVVLMVAIIPIIVKMTAE